MRHITVGLYATPSDKEFLEFMRNRAEEAVDVVLVDRTQSVEEQVAVSRDVEIMVPFHAPLSMGLIQGCAKLKLIQVMGAGTDNLDKAALAAMGIAVANSGGANSVAVAEHAIMLMIMVYRKVRHQILDVLEGLWSHRIRDSYPIHEFHELTGKTVGIVAAGNIGRNVARRLSGWDCRLVYTDPRPVPVQLERELGLTRAGLAELLRMSDVVTLHVPLTARSRGMIGRHELEMMKPTAILVNTCRGAVVDEKALYEALRSRRILGAGLDVTEEEPTPVDNPLLKLDNVVVTPHLAGYTIEWYRKGLAFAVENAARVSRGEEPLCLVGVDE